MTHAAGPDRDACAERALDADLVHSAQPLAAAPRARCLSAGGYGGSSAARFQRPPCQRHPSIISIAFRNPCLHRVGTKQRNTAMSNAPASTIFADFIDRAREHARWHDQSLDHAGLIRLLNEHPALHIEQAGPGTALSITLTMQAEAGEAAGAVLASPAVQDAVAAATFLHNALAGGGGGSVFGTPPTQGEEYAPDPAGTLEDARRGRRNEETNHAMQVMERGHALRVLSYPHHDDRPPSPEALEWVARLIDIWASETPHHLDRGDPEGWGMRQSDRAARASLLERLALNAALHWRAGTPGTDAEDAPAVAWVSLRAFAMNLQADEMEARAFDALQSRNY